MKQLVGRQESYIGQLERELNFCREQLGKVLSLVAHVGEEEGQGEQLLRRLQAMEVEVRGSEERQEELRHREEEARRRDEENRQLKEQLKSVACPDGETELVVKLRVEVSSLQAKEAEAAEQVARSVGVAEQLGAAKAEAEFEAGQLRSQVERQQGRIRGLIEEQCSKVEEEREAMERRWREQVEGVRREAAAAREEVGRGTREVERLGRSEAELKQVVEERERAVGRMREEMEKRVGQLQLEAVEAMAGRQAAEREANSSRLRGEREVAEATLEREGLQAEVESVRSRLRGTEEALVEARREQVGLVEKVAGLEVDLAGERRRREAAERRRAEEATELRDAKEAESERLRRDAATKEKRLRRDTEQLDGLVRRQSKVIGELREQCEAVTNRLEASHGEWREERGVLRTEVQRLRAREGELAEEVDTMVRQSKEHGKLHEKLLGQIRRLEGAGEVTSKAGVEVGRMRRVSAITVEREGRVRHLLTTLPSPHSSPKTKGAVY